jgi:DNA-binding MarR family transcriptional regulator
MTIKKAMKNSFTKADYERLSAFRYALREFLKFSEGAAKEAGLTVQQHQALLTIKGFPGRDHITNGELAEWLQIKHHSAVGLVNRLEAQGLIYRERSDTDKRTVYIYLTAHGTALLEQLTTTHQEELQSIAPQLRLLLETLDSNS